jgi:hypothetical protein
MFTSAIREQYNSLSKYGENIYLLLLAMESMLEQDLNFNYCVKKTLEELNHARISEKQLTINLLHTLSESTRDYIDRKIASNFIGDGINVVGFTVTYDQLYSSIYCARYLNKQYENINKLFIFGGGGACLPTSIEILKATIPDSLIILGEGEEKLTSLLKHLLMIDVDFEFAKLLHSLSNCTQGILIASEYNENVDINKQIAKSVQLPMSNLPPPDYADYFTELQESFGDSSEMDEFKRKNIALVLSGSRGCYGRCDFCASRRMMPKYRFSKPDIVARTALSLSEKHNINTVIFSDLSCDEWIECYADYLILRGRQLHSFAELRADHSESFWVKLAMTGTKVVQIGFESLSTPLLDRMKKGTSVIDNLQTRKYLKELDISSSSNLIVYHPLSTVDDVIETQRILEFIPHLTFSLSYFGLRFGSNQFCSLTKREQNQIRMIYPYRSDIVGKYGFSNWDTIKYPEPINRFAVGSRGYVLQCEIPQRLMVRGTVRDAWGKFIRWFDERNEKNSPRDELRVVTKEANCLQISDNRFSSRRIYFLKGQESIIYNTCHKARSIQEIHERYNIDCEAVKHIVNKFVNMKIMVDVGSLFLSVAIRDRDEVLGKFIACRD